LTVRPRIIIIIITGWVIRHILLIKRLWVRFPTLQEFKNWIRFGTESFSSKTEYVQ